MSTPDGSSESPDSGPDERYVQPDPVDTPFTAPGAPAQPPTAPAAPAQPPAVPPTYPGFAQAPPGYPPATAPGYGPPPGYGVPPGPYGPPAPGAYGPPRGAYPPPHPSAYQRPPSSLRGGMIGAGIGIGFGAILLLWVLLPLLLNAPFTVLLLMSIIPVAGALMCIWKETRSIGLGMLIAGATFFLSGIGPCFVLITAY